MKIVYSLLVMIAAFMPPVSRADQIVIYGQDRALLLSLENMQTNSLFSSDDTALVVDGLKSSYDEIRVAAIKVVLIHRLNEVWLSHRIELDPVVGTSKKLQPIVDAVLSSPHKSEKTIVELLPNESIKLLPLKADPIKPRAKNGDVPIEDVLLDVVIKDVARLNSPAQKEAVLGKLKDFRLSDEHVPVSVP